MNSFCSSTQVDDDIVAACADPLWPWAAEREYTSARQDIHYYNFNAANDMAFSLDPITAMGSSTRLLTQENFMYPVSKRRFEHQSDLPWCAIGRP